ncbi:ABC transporter ATP-binding protein [Desulfosporosinus shakirovi]|uniref:ABC transporter ATP-binding protein n=1 Tax=Desulfosporosinus shakirovi TaxID=2885154 RepID=UPI001E64660D|nr:ABC transporter ATP-binding protein [Desulfosporosinus sp. SRJS8]MCB8817800.1 ABC transporter ATP-binding protein [Desulfosporosinus sp. SRJS8]
MGFLTLDHIHYSYPGQGSTVKDVTWQIEEGEFHCLLGKSGCGKTTLLKLAAGLLKPDKGKVYWQGVEVFKPSSQVGYVFQSPTLLEWKTVFDNVLLPISLKRKPNSKELDYGETLLELMGIISQKDKYPTELSGGQQSRVAIARSLIQSPSMLFLDEPFAAVDAITREELQDDLLKLCQLRKTTVIFITHDITEAVYLSDHVAIMSGGQIVQDYNVNLPKERSFEMRYDSYFNELCLKIRQSFSGVSS